METHMSWVFLTDAHVYKLKKPVKYDFLDLSTVERRRLNGEEEVRLNRRLAGSVYEGVMPLIRDASGYSLKGKGEIVDWLVKMKRLPDAASFEQKILHHQLSEEEIRQIAQLLTDFYRQCPSMHWSGPEYLNRLQKGVSQLQEELLQYPLLPAKEVKKVFTLQQKFLHEKSAWLEQRATAGKIVEGHGDLKPEHIFLTNPPVIIDCLEFNRDLRLLDIADELSFLVLECEVLQAGWVGERILQHYQAAARDTIPGGVIHFYKSVRAGLRAKLAARHLMEPRYQQQDKWIKQALLYLGLSMAAWKENIGE